MIVPFVMPGWDLTGNGLLLEIAATTVGLALGLLACSCMKVSVDTNGQAWTDAGAAYALAWIAITAARQLFIYGCQHWYTRDLGEFLINDHISVSAFADSIMLLSVTAVIGNRLAILARSRLAAARSGLGSLAPTN